jgi:putative membrane protein
MLRALAYLIVNALVILGLAQVLPNFAVEDYVAAIVFVLILTVLNWTVLPVLKFFALPFNLLTLGLVNGLLNLLGIGLAAWLVDGVIIYGEVWSQLLTTLVIAVVLAVSSGIVEKALKKEDD